MNRFRNCRLLIADYYESLRFDVDIYQEEFLKKAQENSHKSTLLPVKTLISTNYHVNKASKRQDLALNQTTQNEEESYGIEYFNDQYSDEYQYVDETTTIENSERKSSNVIRSELISELKKMEKETLHYYDSNSSRFKFEPNETDENKIEALRTQIFAKKFCFLMNVTDLYQNSADEFNLCLFITDFYLSPKHIQYLK